MHLYVVRHGETLANVQQRYLGSLDPELTSWGRQQAQDLANVLPQDIDVIIVSPRLRATETACILNERLKLPLHVMECFRERDVGVFEGLTQAEARERYPELWAQNITRLWEAGPTKGESIYDVVKRVRDGLVELEINYASNTVLIVAHGFVAKTIRALAKANFSDFFDWKLANGSMLALPEFQSPILDTDILKVSLPLV